MSICVHACVFVCTRVSLDSWGSTLLSSSARKECLSVSVSAFSAGTISVEGKEHKETLKELLCTFE